MSEYTIYELLYEYHSRLERQKVIENRSNEEADKIEDDKIQEAMDWAEQEELKEAELKKKAEEEEAWMLEQLKKEHGEDFGDDLNMSFTE